MDLVEYNSAVRDGRNIDIVGKITRELYLDSLKKLEDRLKFHPNDSIVVTLSTEGGEVDYAWCLYNRLACLRHDPDVDISIVANVFIRSAGVVPLLAIAREKRFALPHTHIYCHKIRREIPGNPPSTPEEIEICLREQGASNSNVLNNTAKFCELIVRETDYTVEQVNNLLDNPIHIYTGDAVKRGFFSRVLMP